MQEVIISFFFVGSEIYLDCLFCYVHTLLLAIIKLNGERNAILEVFKESTEIQMLGSPPYILAY